MARAENQPIMTNGYPISKWALGVPIIDDDEDEKEISNSMDQVAYDVHVDPYFEDDKDNKDDEDD